LRQAGWDVALYEQAPALEPMGAALSLWPNAIAALTWLGCDRPVRDNAQQLTELALVERDGRMIAPANVEAALPGASAYLPERTLLQAALLTGLEGVEPRLGHRLIRFTQSADRVSVEFDNGEHDEGDLLVAADGIWSAIATKVIGTSPRHAGYGGVLALSDPVPGYPSTGRGDEYWGMGERFGLIDLTRDRKYWFYMRNEKDPAESRTLTHDWIANRVGEWCAPIQAALAVTPADRIIPFSIHARPAPKRLGQGRIICTGDAAHAMEPNLGQGGCQALEDAVALGIAARGDDVGGILPHFERLRLKRIRSIVALSAQGGIVPHHLPDWLSRISRTGMRQFLPLIVERSQRSLFAMPDYR
jgi:2-polyprenyl-6-methoxyphenol hydroxylase-like FAD-dependent oxidoreductase